MVKIEKHEFNIYFLNAYFYLKRINLDKKNENLGKEPSKLI